MNANYDSDEESDISPFSGGSSPSFNDSLVAKNEFLLF